MLQLVSTNDQSQVNKRKHQLRIKMRRIEEILLTCFSLPRMYTLLRKSEEQLERARVKPRIKKLIKYRQQCERSIVGDRSSIEMAYSRPLSGYEALRERVKRRSKAS